MGAITDQLILTESRKEKKNLALFLFESRYEAQGDVTAQLLKLQKLPK